MNRQRVLPHTCLQNRALSHSGHVGTYIYFSMFTAITSVMPSSPYGFSTRITPKDQSIDFSRLYLSSIFIDSLAAVQQMEFQTVFNLHSVYQKLSFRQLLFKSFVDRVFKLVVYCPLTLSPPSRFVNAKKNKKPSLISGRRSMLFEIFYTRLHNTSRQRPSQFVKVSQRLMCVYLIIYTNKYLTIAKNSNFF